LISLLGEQEASKDAAASSAPKTAQLCKDIKYIYGEASWSYVKMMSMKKKINSVCKVIKKANEMCVKTRQINTHTGTADAVIQPAKNFPYIGPILKLVAPVTKQVKAATKKPAEFCDKMDRNLKLANLAGKCSKIQGYITQSEMKLGLIFADVELVDELWCKCDSALVDMKHTAKAMADAAKGKMGGHPKRSKEVTASCKVIADDAKKNKSRRQCFSLNKWYCPADPLIARGKNALHLAEKYSCIRPKVEEWSDKVDQDIAGLRQAIEETKKRMNSMVSYLDWSLQLEFITQPHFVGPIDGFFAVINPLSGFLSKLRSFLDAEIKLKFPGCEEAQTKEELESLLQQRFNMTMREAMVPVPDLHKHPTMMLLQKQFVDHIKYHQLTPDDAFEPIPSSDAQETLETPEAQLENEMAVKTNVARGARRLLSVDKNTPHKPKRLQARKSDNTDDEQDASTFVDDTEKGTVDLLDAKNGATQAGKAKWGGRRRRWHGHWPHGHWPHGHWPHPHIPHRHHIHVPHRHHIHIPHRHHIHIPHRHHFHAAAIVKSIGAGIVEGIKKIGDLICYEIRFSVMDILRGIGKFLSWMMAPLDAAIAALLRGMGISLPGLSLPWPAFNFNVPSFNFNFDHDFLAFNWPALQFDLKLLAGLSIGELPAIKLPCSEQEQLSLVQQKNPCDAVCPTPGCDSPQDASKEMCKECAECHRKNYDSNDSQLSLVQQESMTRPCDDVCPTPDCDKPEDSSKDVCKDCAECHKKNDQVKKEIEVPHIDHTHAPVDESAEEGEITMAPLP
jgi:hypothetical protein